MFEAAELGRTIADLEQTLTRDGSILLKFWFHLPSAEQKKRLQADANVSKLKKSPLLESFSRSYNAFLAASERALRLTDTGYAPWHIIEATDMRYRDIAMGSILVETLRETLEADAVSAGTSASRQVRCDEEDMVTSILGNMTIYDRSWYGRVLVERVEGFASKPEWLRSYQEINDFEEHLVNKGAVLCKFWVHIDKDEQLRRFREREKDPRKQHKIADEDWRNREKWSAYEEAVNDMVAHTSTTRTPWTLVAGNDKKFARVQILRILCERLQRAVDKK